MIDIDGTALTQQKPGEYAKCQPIPGAVEFINKLYENGHQIVFFTSRNFKYMQQTHEQLRGFGFKYHHLDMGKPHGDIIIDDRAVRFKSWSETGPLVQALLDTPWAED
ncbi:MAG: HAD family acid phosphatase [Verrucomicrobiota bacterium]